ncbi:hypothetical protein RTM1035_19801 [Roseovarius sp. TM1035]|nr:Hypothetical protein RAK1035_1378 [Roseovarius sp. AK1035]EDM31603.1 hypothetical protein RTM1035_19801 [Roseovarius sp. TM1035]
MLPSARGQSATLNNFKFHGASGASPTACVSTDHAAERGIKK